MSEIAALLPSKLTTIVSASVTQQNKKLLAYNFEI